MPPRPLPTTHRRLPCVATLRGLAVYAAVAAASIAAASIGVFTIFEGDVVAMREALGLSAEAAGPVRAHVPPHPGVAKESR